MSITMIQFFGYGYSIQPFSQQYSASRTKSPEVVVRNVKIYSLLPRKYTHLPYSVLSVSITVSSVVVYCNNHCRKDAA